MREEREREREREKIDLVALCSFPRCFLTFLSSFFFSIIVAPMSSEAFASAFKASPHYQEALAQLPSVVAPPLAYQAPEAQRAYSRYGSSRREREREKRKKKKEEREREKE